MPDVYRDNPNLKRANVQIQYTKEQVQEYQKCMEDPVYFTENYIKIVSLDEGLIPFILYEFQRQMMWTFIRRDLLSANSLDSQENPLQLLHICYTTVCSMLQ